MYEYVCFHSILYEASKSIVKLDHHLLASKKTPKNKKPERVTIWFVNFSLRLPLIYIIVNRVASVYLLLDNQAKNPNLFIILVHACKFYKKFCCTGWVQIIEHEPWTPFLIFSIYSITYVWISVTISFTISKFHVNTEKDLLPLSKILQLHFFLFFYDY